ncbi:MAG: alpha/beta hydrolase [Tetrasphaera sp.]
MNEVPLYAMAGLTASTIVALAQGDLTTPGGMVGAVAAGLTIVALVGLTLRARRSRDALDRALDAGLGADWRAQIDPELRRQPRSRTSWVRTLLLRLRRRRRDVEHRRNLSYGPHGRHNRLDVYRHRSHPAGAPVLIHLHGGAFVSGRKDHESLPLIHRFASQGWLCISANYRIGRHVDFPDHLVDVKRVIAWVREHGGEFGAAPEMLVVAGDSAGGHLAVTAALTPGDPAYQPGFEDADTSVSAAVGLYGYYGRTDSSLVGSSPADHLHPDAPPIMLVHGDHDSNVPVAWARSFARRLRAGWRGPVVYAELPGAQHTFDLLNSVRGSLTVDGVEAFCAWVRSCSGVSPVGNAEARQPTPGDRPRASAGPC